jgi:hypothetical protein
MAAATASDASSKPMHLDGQVLHTLVKRERLPGPACGRACTCFRPLSGVSLRSHPSFVYGRLCRKPRFRVSAEAALPNAHISRSRRKTDCALPHIRKPTCSRSRKPHFFRSRSDK